MVLDFAAFFNFKISYFRFLLRAKGIVTRVSFIPKKVKLRKPPKLRVQSLTSGTVVSPLVQLFNAVPPPRPAERCSDLRAPGRPPLPLLASYCKTLAGNYWRAHLPFPHLFHFDLEFATDSFHVISGIYLRGNLYNTD